MWKLYKADPVYFRKHNWRLVLFIVVFYCWFLIGSLSHGRSPWFRITFKIFEQIAAAYLWYILGFRMSQNIKIPNEDNNEIPTKADRVENIEPTL